MKVNVDVDTGDIVEDRTADSRGRVNLGSEYAGKTVTVAVVEDGDDEDRAECPNGCGPLAVMARDDAAGSLGEVECPECGYIGGTVP